MANIFPRLLRLALKALAHEKRQEIVSYLLEAGSATPSKIRKRLGMESNELTYHLKKLMLGNIVERIVEEGRVKYRLSPFGAKLLYNIFAVLEPPAPMERRRHSRSDIYLYTTTRDEIYSLMYDYPEQALNAYTEVREVV